MAEKKSKGTVVRFVQSDTDGEAIMKQAFEVSVPGLIILVWIQQKWMV